VADAVADMVADAVAGSAPTATEREVLKTAETAASWPKAIGPKAKLTAASGDTSHRASDVGAIA
jgi:hypothetical protein